MLLVFLNVLLPSLLFYSLIIWTNKSLFIVLHNRCRAYKNYVTGGFYYSTTLWVLELLATKLIKKVHRSSLLAASTGPMRWEWGWGWVTGRIHRTSLPTTALQSSATYTYTVGIVRVVSAYAQHSGVLLDRSHSVSFVFTFEGDRLLSDGRPFVCLSPCNARTYVKNFHGICKIRTREELFKY